MDNTVNWVEVARNLVGALDACVTQIEQMKGLFPDDDGMIGQALQDAEEAVAVFNEASSASDLPEADEELVQSIAEKIRDAGDVLVLDDAVHEIFTGRASKVNNQGLETQIRCLLADGCDERTVLEKADISNPACRRSI